MVREVVRWPVQLAVQCAFNYPNGEVSILVPTYLPPHFGARGSTDPRILLEAYPPATADDFEIETGGEK